MTTPFLNCWTPFRRKPKPRKIRFMSHAKAKAAGDWAIKKYSKVFERLSKL